MPKNSQSISTSQNIFFFGVHKWLERTTSLPKKNHLKKKSTPRKNIHPRKKNPPPKKKIHPLIHAPLVSFSTRSQGKKDDCQNFCRCQKIYRDLETLHKFFLASTKSLTIIFLACERVEKVTCVHQKKTFWNLGTLHKFFGIDKHFNSNRFYHVNTWKK